MKTFIPLVITFFASASLSQTEEDLARRLQRRLGKLFSLFQVVEFTNDPCFDATGNEGLCYTVEQCNMKLGRIGNSCANGYGICCVFSMSCDSYHSENLTHFTSEAIIGPAAGAATGSRSGFTQCPAKICPMNVNICQLRLDFIAFDIAQPNTDTAAAVQLLNGNVVDFVDTANKFGISATTATRCGTDWFTVKAPGTGAQPRLCGRNNGEHMYVDLNTGCLDLLFTLSTEFSAAARWDIKVSQLSCDSPWRAPEGCRQWHTGSDGTGSVKSFNYDGGLHLANQDQNICVRRESGKCRICWYAVDPLDFAVSGTATKTTGPGVGQGFNGNQCCGYGGNGMGTKGFDCVVIPSAALADSDTAATEVRGDLIGLEFCGRNAGLVKKNQGTSSTVCSTSLPFQIRFSTDSYEFLKEAKVPTKGFQLRYFQDTAC